MKGLRLCYVGPGDSVSLRRWVEWFAARGHEATIVTVEAAEPALLRGVRQVDLGRHGGPRKIGRLLAAVRMALAVSRLRPDVVHVHYLRGLAWGILLKKPKPYVVTPWGSDILEDQGAYREWYSKALTRRLLAAADLVTAHSAYMEQQVRRLLPPAQGVCRIGWGVDLGLFRSGWDVGELRRRLGIEEGRRVIFSPRIARAFYNHDRIITALPAVSRSIPDAALIITSHFGDPVYLERLRRLAADLGVSDRVWFVDSIPYADMPRWLNLAAAVVLIPPSDGMPSTLLEAMACGPVPILTRLPQYTEVIQHGVNGFLVDRDGQELVQALTGVLKDAALRRDIAGRNRRIVAEIGDQTLEMSRMQEKYQELGALGAEARGRARVPLAAARSRSS